MLYGSEKGLKCDCGQTVMKTILNLTQRNIVVEWYYRPVENNDPPPKVTPNQIGEIFLNKKTIPNKFKNVKFW